MLLTLTVLLTLEDYYKLLGLGRFQCKISVCEGGPNSNQTLSDDQNPIQKYKTQ